jgi:hypothetical protein
MPGDFEALCVLPCFKKKFGEISPNLDLKNMISTYICRFFSWKKKAQIRKILEGKKFQVMS